MNGGAGERRLVVRPMPGALEVSGERRTGHPAVRRRPRRPVGHETVLSTQPHRFLRGCTCTRLPPVGPAENASQWRGERDERLGARARNAAGVVDLLAHTTFTVELPHCCPAVGASGRTRKEWGGLEVLEEAQGSRTLGPKDEQWRRLVADCRFSEFDSRRLHHGTAGFPRSRRFVGSVTRPCQAADAPIGAARADSDGPCQLACQSGLAVGTPDFRSGRRRTPNNDAAPQRHVVGPAWYRSSRRRRADDAA